MAFTQASQSSLEELSSSFLHVRIGVMSLRFRDDKPPNWGLS